MTESEAVLIIQYYLNDGVGQDIIIVCTSNMKGCEAVLLLKKIKV